MLCKMMILFDHYGTDHVAVYLQSLLCYCAVPIPRYISVLLLLKSSVMQNDNLLVAIRNGSCDAVLAIIAM